ncbi:hypothetical protein CVT24_006948 [Panaeolus cyanescens]|uniref:F-box domain-containing protein n=1 Tax=Panaeolus cyanescens TaxID=181874 RepID=A0A409W5I7_9AGAR|nr:hypothetical protein CVT24_006948 [Panaeolus cyanescens]
MTLSTRLQGLLKRVCPRKSRFTDGTSNTPPKMPHSLFSLPPELIVLVFELLISDRENPMTPTSLSAVSRFFRTLVVGSPSLWSYLLVDAPSLSHPQHLELYLRRSASHPLDILIDIRDPVWNWSEESHCFQFNELYTALEMLISHCTQWKRFEMLSDTWKPIHDFLLRTQSITVPNLEVLSLTRANVYFARYRQTFMPANLAAPLSLFGGASTPLLRSIALAGVHMEWAQPPFHNLTTLELRYHSLQVMPSLQQFGAICDSCPDLRNLTIMGWGPQLPPTSSNAGSGIFVLPRLTSFSFGYVNVEYAIRLLILFNLPSLRKLTIENLQKLVYNDTTATDDTPLLQWFVASPTQAQASPFLPYNPRALPVPDVTHLNINDIGAQQAILASFVRRFTSLTHLSCHSVSHDTITAILHGAQHSLAGMHGNSQGSIQEIRCRNVEPASLLSFVHASAQAGLPIPAGMIVLEIRDRDGMITESSSSTASTSSSMTDSLIQAGIKVVRFI